MAEVGFSVTNREEDLELCIGVLRADARTVREAVKRLPIADAERIGWLYHALSTIEKGIERLEQYRQGDYPSREGIPF